MIKRKGIIVDSRVKRYGVECDNSACKIFIMLPETHTPGPNDSIGEYCLAFAARYMGWITIGGKTYCHSCVKGMLTLKPHSAQPSLGGAIDLPGPDKKS